MERAPEEDLAETNQDHTEDANVPVPSPKIKKGKGKAVPEIAGGDGAENDNVPEELKPSEPSPKAKKGKKKNAKNVQEEASTSGVKPAGDESQVVSIPTAPSNSTLANLNYWSEDEDTEIASVPKELTPPEPKGTFNFIKLFYLVRFLLQNRILTNQPK